MDIRERIVAEARTWLGTPYHHQGKVKGVGVDCAMILVDVYRQVGLIPEIDPRPYPPDWHLHRDEERYLGWVQQYGKEVETPKPGDVVLFKFGRCLSHGGIVVDWPVIIHSYYGIGVIYEDVSRGPLARRKQVFYSVVADHE